MKKTLIILAGMLGLSFASNGQNLIGVRGGWFSGITFQHYLDDSKALEFIAQGSPNLINFTALYQAHQDFSDVQNMKWYYGAGGHFGSFRYRRDNPFFGDRYTEDAAIIGVDGIIGLEYFFDEIPFQVSVDYKPMLNLTGGGWIYHDAALALRFVF